MTDKQITLFEGAVSNTLTQFGYPLVTMAKPISLPIKAWWRFHNYILSRINSK